MSPPPPAPATPPGGAVPRPTVPAGRAPAITVLPASQESALKNKVLSTIAANMGVPVANVPKDVQDIVSAQVKQSLADNVQAIVREVVGRQVKTQLTKSVDMLGVLDERLKGAQKGIEHVGQNEEVRKIMAENARLLRLKYTTLVEAGFTGDQAFQIVLTDLGKPRR